MSDATVVNKAIELVGPFIKEQSWIAETLSESERERVVRQLLRRINKADTGTPEHELAEIFAAEHMAEGSCRSALREACIEISRQLDAADEAATTADVKVMA